MKLGVKTEDEDPAAVLSCHACPKKSFSGAAALIAHLKSHKLEKKVDCSSPGCKFSGKLDALKNHARAMHTKERVFVCPHCPSKFFNYGARISHLKKHRSTSSVVDAGSSTNESREVAGAVGGRQTRPCCSKTGGQQLGL